MSYEISIDYEVLDSLGIHYLKRTLILEPDQLINYQFSGSFNWVGSCSAEGENIDIIIHQKNVNNDPLESDINIDPRIFIDKAVIIRKIKDLLNQKMN